MADAALNTGGEVGMEGTHAAEGSMGKPICHLQSSEHSTTGNDLQMMLRKSFSSGNPLLSLQSTLISSSLLKSIATNHPLSCYFGVIGFMMLRALTCQLSMLQTHRKWISVRRSEADDVISQTVPSQVSLSSVLEYTDRRKPN